MKPIYLDYNATTPIDPAVAAAMRPYLEEYFGNPSSSHWYGIQTKKAVEKARKQIANLLGCFADEIIFTSGGSESNNLAIKGVAEAHQHKGEHIITSAIEHPAVLEVCAYLESKGFHVTYLPVDQYGVVKLEALASAITDRTILITIMHANNEVGTIQPIAEISKNARNHGIIIHTDAAQTVGKISTRVDELGVDLLSIAGHKIYAPKGIGALYVRRGTQLQKLIHGADHEQKRRAGTENVLEIVGLGEACEIAAQNIEFNISHTRKMRDRLYKGITDRLKNVYLNGHPEQRLPNTLNISFENLEANTILSETEGIAASAGAACHADSVDVSTTLEAMKVPIERAMGTIRFSTGRMTTPEEIDRAIDIVVKAVEHLQPGGSQPASTELEMKEMKLTHYTHGLGCACKLRPQALEEIVRKIPPIADANVLIGTDTVDDAAVYQIDDDTAIVQTVDFFTPIVDDPYQFGAIAAANALSDIYAMGARPLWALNVVGFPSNRLPLEVLEQILQGAYDKTREAGIAIIGGHTIDDTEPKYGLVVTGVVHPERIWTNSGAQPGDVLVLTKPIGTGILATAQKRGLIENVKMVKPIQLMGELNARAAQALAQFEVHACTDVTGFGLLGHLLEIAHASNVSAELFLKKVPFLEDAWDLAVANVVPGGTLNNLEYVSKHVVWDDSIPQPGRILLSDAQTSGGLLIAVAAAEGERLLKMLQENSVAEAKIIGSVTEGDSPAINVSE